MGYVELGDESVPIAEHTRLMQRLIYGKGSSGIGRLVPSDIPRTQLKILTKKKDFEIEVLFCTLQDNSPHLNQITLCSS